MENNSFENQVQTESSTLPQEESTFSQSSQTQPQPLKKSRKKLFTGLTGVFVVLVAIVGALGTGNFFQGALILGRDVPQNITVESCEQNPLNDCTTVKLEQVKQMNFNPKKEVVFGKQYFNFQDVNLGVYRSTEVLEMYPNMPSRFKISPLETVSNPLETLILVIDTEIVDQLFTGNTSFDFESTYCSSDDTTLNCDKFLHELFRSSSMARLALNTHGLDSALPRVAFNLDGTLIEVETTEDNSEFTRLLTQSSKMNDLGNKSILIFSSEYPYFTQLFLQLFSDTNSDEEDEEIAEQIQTINIDRSEEINLRTREAIQVMPQDTSQNTESNILDSPSQDISTSQTRMLQPIEDDGPVSNPEPEASVEDPLPQINTGQRIEYDLNQAEMGVTIPTETTDPVLNTLNTQERQDALILLQSENGEVDREESSEIAKFFKELLEISIQEKNRTRSTGTLNIIDITYLEVENSALELQVPNFDDNTDLVSFILDTYNTEGLDEIPLNFIDAKQYFASTAIQTTFKTILEINPSNFEQLQNSIRNRLEPLEEKITILEDSDDQESKDELKKHKKEAKPLRLMQNYLTLVTNQENPSTRDDKAELLQELFILELTERIQDSLNNENIDLGFHILADENENLQRLELKHDNLYELRSHSDSDRAIIMGGLDFAVPVQNVAQLLVDVWAAASGIYDFSNFLDSITGFVSGENATLTVFNQNRPIRNLLNTVNNLSFIKLTSVNPYDISTVNTSCPKQKNTFNILVDIVEKGHFSFGKFTTFDRQSDCEGVMVLVATDNSPADVSEARAKKSIEERSLASNIQEISPARQVQVYLVPYIRKASEVKVVSEEPEEDVTGDSQEVEDTTQDVDEKSTTSSDTQDSTRQIVPIRTTTQGGGGVSQSSVVTSTPPPDIHFACDWSTTSAPTRQAVESLYLAGIFRGNQRNNGNCIDEFQGLNRMAGAAFIHRTVVNALNKNFPTASQDFMSTTLTTRFSDLATQFDAEWGTKYIFDLSQEGIFRGFTVNNFQEARLNQTMTQVEYAKLLVESVDPNFTNDDSKTLWSLDTQNYVLENLGLRIGNDPANRAFTVNITNLMLEKHGYLN